MRPRLSDRDDAPLKDSRIGWITKVHFTLRLTLDGRE
jgi:hypothetical protein